MPPLRTPAEITHIDARTLIIPSMKIGRRQKPSVTNWARMTAIVVTGPNITEILMAITSINSRRSVKPRAAIGIGRNVKQGITSFDMIEKV